MSQHRLLVAGGDRVDAGKTTFSTGLLAHWDAVGFKPRAGNDHWFDHDDVRRAVADGRLYGKDATRLADASVGRFAPEDLNPVHRLWRPSPGPDTGLVGAAHREFVCDRVGDAFVVNAHAEVPAAVAEQLPLEDAERVASVEELDAVTRQRHLPAFERFAEKMTGAERAVVESYGDVALPIRDVAFDAVAVVEPASARLYDGDRFLKACKVASGSPRDGQLEVHTGDVTDLVDAEASFSLPPLRDEERTDAASVADAYRHVYDDLLAVAGE